MKKTLFIKYTVFSLILLFSNSSFAGFQKESDLKDEFITSLSQSLSLEYESTISSFLNLDEENEWISSNLSKIIKHFNDENEAVSFLKSVHYEATRAALDPYLILGLIKVESGFQKYAISNVDARGYMQVMPFWVKAIGQEDHNLFHLRTNLRYGCSILKHYLQLENGNLFLALGRYNGTRGQSKYPNLVLNARKQFTNK